MAITNAEYNCKVYVVDEVMDRGKSWAAINYMSPHDWGRALNEVKGRW